MPLKVSDPLLDRFRLLTLAIEEAIGCDKWDEVESLIDERGRLLYDLSARKLPVDPIEIKSLGELDARICRFISSRKDEIAQSLRAGTQHKAMARGYRPVSNRQTIEQVG